jgi:hypothetical protein
VTLHFGAQIRARDPDHQMEMIVHNDVAQQLPSVANASFLEPVPQPAAVAVIANDFLPAINSSHHMIDGTLEFSSQSSPHVDRRHA